MNGNLTGATLRLSGQFTGYSNADLQEAETIFDGRVGLPSARPQPPTAIPGRWPLRLRRRRKS